MYTFSKFFLFISFYISLISNYGYAGTPEPCSIMLIIDNSSSNISTPTDRDGNRFKASIKILDYIQTHAPDTRVGLVLFGSRLWFYKPDNQNLFMSIAQDQYHEGNGCCIPPLNLDSTYSGSVSGFKNGVTTYDCKGIDVIKMYLGTYVSTGTMSGTLTNYTPTHKVNYPFEAHSGGLTNITIAFDGAKFGHKNQGAPLDSNADRHFNIFLSDGEAVLNATSPEYSRLKDYIQGKEVPSTATIFYGNDAASLAELQQMTANIKNNGYSVSNALYTTIDTSTDFYTQLLTAVNSFLPVTTKVLPVTSAGRSREQFTMLGDTHCRISAADAWLLHIYDPAGKCVLSISGKGRTVVPLPSCTANRVMIARLSTAKYTVYQKVNVYR